MVENPQRFRRVVTGNDADGRSGVLLDGEAPNTENRGGQGLPNMTEFWCFDEAPAGLSGNDDLGQPPFTAHPPDHGAYLRIVEFSPPPAGYDRESDPVAVAPHPPEEDAVSGWGDRGGRALGRSPIHRTRSVDYGFVVRGEMKLALDEWETVVSKGDAVVQLGDYHQWITTGAPCIMAYVMIGATFD
jgi:mannose-6-phosphate isomerase-like protein (cupin superfamily)